MEWPGGNARIWACLSLTIDEGSVDVVYKILSSAIRAGTMQSCNWYLAVLPSPSHRRNGISHAETNARLLAWAEWVVSSLVSAVAMETENAAAAADTLMATGHAIDAVFKAPSIAGTFWTADWSTQPLYSLR